MTERETKIELIRELIRKYVADDGLKPEYDGFTAWSLADIILKEIEKFDYEKSLDFEQKHREYPDADSEKEYEQTEKDSHTHP